ncbi:hypothetical protein ACS0TY_016588 [Phlomoides rotata]
MAEEKSSEKPIRNLEIEDHRRILVRLTVPATDDPTLPVLTFRTWVLGITSCVMLAFLNQFFDYRQNRLSISSVAAQIVSLPLGKFMAKVLPTKTVRVPLTNWRFSLNPGPFNLKEHVLITIFATCGTLHEDDKRKKGGLTRLQFFLVVFISSFAYYLIPGYFFPTLSSISVVCLVWKKSVFAQQLGSGLYGLGIGSFGLDWATVRYLGNPISTPGFAIVNIMIGFFLILYVQTPITYFNNMYEAKKYPIFTSHTYDSTGKPYNITRVLNPATFNLDIAGYDSYSKLYLSTYFAFAYGIGFATLAATITHVALNDGKTIWSLWSKAQSGKSDDVHTRIMKKNYESVPGWWFHIILVLVVALSMYALEGFGKVLQLPWWGLLMACAMALFFTLPVGILQATTNQQVGLNIITEMVIGYIYPGRPLANVAFKTYGYISMVQALGFLSDFKLGHYMKIPPKSMFIVQTVGTVIASTVYFSTSWWLLTSVDHICDKKLLPAGSPWTCPGDEVFYQASIIWGVIGPLRMFTSKGVYSMMNWWFLAGGLAPIPVYVLGRMYPQKKWIRLINVPVIFGASMGMPPARAVNYIMWGIVGIFFNMYVFRVHKRWWARHAYVMGAALDAGVAFMGILLFIALQSYDIFGPTWWGLDSDDHCPLASCPTAPGVVVEGCPAF